VVSVEHAEVVRLGSAGNHVAVVDGDGEALFATVRNLPRGPAILTASEEGPQPCPLCNADVVTPAHIRARISQFESAVGTGLCPSLQLPPEAWDDANLAIACASCGQPLRFNPFFAASSHKLEIKTTGLVNEWTH
jgi:hypothetical protein